MTESIGHCCADTDDGREVDVLTRLVGDAAD
jgi:hypothetical protein